MPIARVVDGKGVAIPAGDWERINATLERIEVPGGWLYRSRLSYEAAPMVFVPFPRPTQLSATKPDAPF